MPSNNKHSSSRNLDAGTGASAPRVAIIVPARNEEANIGACLRSLVGQDYPNFEIVAVNDASTDRTGEILAELAAEHPCRIRVIVSDSLPEGWTGKNHALALGTENSSAEWFLFTDADTTHAPGSLSRTMQQVAALEVALFSISPSQTCGSFFERLVQPQVFDFLDRIYPFEEVRDPASTVAAANGQYLLVSRKALEACGGIASIRNELLDDVALAELMKRAGPIWFQPDDGRVVTRMYNSPSAVWRGWRKNLWLLFRRRWTQAAGAVSAMLLRRVAPFLCMAIGYHMLFHFEINLRWVLVSGISTAWWITSVAGDARMFARKKVLRSYALLSWLGATIFLLMLCASFLAHSAGRVTWKGREYSSLTEPRN